MFFSFILRTFRLNSVRVQVERKFQKKKQVVPGEHDVKIYMRMASLAGFGWTIGFILFVLPDGQEGFQRYLTATFKYLFILLNSTPGLFIFAVYVCNRRVLGLYRQLFLRIYDFIRTCLRSCAEVFMHFRHSCVARTKHRFQKFQQFMRTDAKDGFALSSSTPVSPVEKLSTSMLWMGPVFDEQDPSIPMEIIYPPEEQCNHSSSQQ